MNKNNLQQILGELIKELINLTPNLSIMPNEIYKVDFKFKSDKDGNIAISNFNLRKK